MLTKASLFGSSDVVGDYTERLTEEVSQEQVGTAQWQGGCLCHAVGQCQGPTRFSAASLCLPQIHGLAKAVKAFVPEKADEIMSQDKQKKVKAYIKRQGAQALG